MKRITPGTTTGTPTTTAATTTSIITSIRSTTSADIKTPTSSESQVISGTSSVSSTSIRINQSSGSTQEHPATESAIVNNGITQGTTTRTTTTTAATTTSILISIRSTTSTEVAKSFLSTVASSSTTSGLSSRQFADIKTPTSSEPQSISGKSSVPSTSTSIGINESSGSTQELPATESAIVNNGITQGTTTRTTTTTAVTTTSIITSIRSTTSAEVAKSIFSTVASSSATSGLSSQQFADIKTPTSSEPQSISGKSPVPSTSTSIGINESSGSTQELPATESAIVNNEFPMFGRIGLGIIVVLIIAVIVLVIQRCKKKRIDKGISCSHQTSVEPSDHTSGMKLSDSVNLDVMNFEDNAMHNADKYTSDVWDRQPDSDYYTIHIDDKARQETGRVLCDRNDQSYVYATVDISKKSVPKHI